MANNCYNNLEIKGSKEDILRLEECIKSKTKDKIDKWDLRNIIPIEIDDEGYYKVKNLQENVKLDNRDWYFKVTAKTVDGKSYSF